MQQIESVALVLNVQMDLCHENVGRKDVFDSVVPDLGDGHEGLQLQLLQQVDPRAVEVGVRVEDVNKKSHLFFLLLLLYCLL